MPLYYPLHRGATVLAMAETVITALLFQHSVEAMFFGVVQLSPLNSILQPLFLCVCLYLSRSFPLCFAQLYLTCFACAFGLQWP
eukprot:m.36339 g.36339  ORF g.36339 m.36339 type:complete len:84 (+) comp9986_c1_seq1:39-290(+)